MVIKKVHFLLWYRCLGRFLPSLRLRRWTVNRGLSFQVFSTPTLTGHSLPVTPSRKGQPLPFTRRGSDISAVILLTYPQTSLTRVLLTTTCGGTPYILVTGSVVLSFSHPGPVPVLGVLPSRSDPVTCRTSPTGRPRSTEVSRIGGRLVPTSSFEFTDHLTSLTCVRWYRSSQWTRGVTESSRGVVGSNIFQSKPIDGPISVSVG